MKDWAKISTKYGLQAGGICLIIIVLTMLVNPIWVLAFNIPIFLVIIVTAMFMMTKKVNAGPDFIGFNNMLKPLLRTFVIGLLIYYFGFVLLEYFVFTDLNTYRNQLSLKLLERFSSFLEDQQVEAIREGIKNSSTEVSSISIPGIVMSLALYFAVFGLPLSIFVAAVVNGGFNNEEKIGRNE